jgi:hypothetical protein
VADLAVQLERWPGYVSEALELGVRGVYAFPLQLGATCFGVLDLYRDRPDHLDQHRLAIGATFAEAAVLVLLDAVDGSDLTEGTPEVRLRGGLGDLGSGLGEAFDHHPEIHQAQGMVSVDLALSLSDALVRMRARAFAAGTTLLELSRRIIAGTEDAWDSDATRNDPEAGGPELESDPGG